MKVLKISFYMKHRDARKEKG